MNGSLLSEDAVLAEFDRRRKAGVIFYDENPRIQTRTIGGYQFEFAVTEAIGKKPYIKDNSDEPVTSNPRVQRPPGYALGSDIDVSGYEITDVNETHLLAFNKFCMYRPHLLLLTKDGYRRQYEHLDVDDFLSAWRVLESLDWKYFMFFNCGKDGGCSRLHKHMQAAPLEKGRLYPWPEDLDNDGRSAPFEFILRRFENRLGPKQITDLYKQMMGEAKAMLGQPEGSPSDHVPHNVVLGRNWILVIPRCKAGSVGAYGNSLGMLGMVSVASDEELRCWLDQGPMTVLSRLGKSTTRAQ